MAAAGAVPRATNTDATVVAADVRNGSTATGLSVLISATDSTTITNNLATIHAVDVSILVRTSHQDPTYANTTTYRTLSGPHRRPFNDGHRRRPLTTIVHCTNL